MRLLTVRIDADSLSADATADPVPATTFGEMFVGPASVAAPTAIFRRRDRLRESLAAEAVAKGADMTAVEGAIVELESQRPILDLLLSGGFERILELILLLAKQRA